MNVEICIFIGITVAFGIALFLLNKKVNRIKARTDGMKKLLWAATYIPERVSKLLEQDFDPFDLVRKEDKELK